MSKYNNSSLEIDSLYKKYLKYCQSKGIKPIPKTYISISILRNILKNTKYLQENKMYKNKEQIIKDIMMEHKTIKLKDLIKEDKYGVTDDFGTLFINLEKNDKGNYIEIAAPYGGLVKFHSIKKINLVIKKLEDLKSQLS